MLGIVVGNPGGARFAVDGAAVDVLASVVADESSGGALAGVDGVDIGGEGYPGPSCVVWRNKVSNFRFGLRWQ
jgi:hypothetical protein